VTTWRPVLNRLENPAQPLTSSALAEWLGGTTLDAGVVVTPWSSLGMSAVWRSVVVTSAVAAALPLHAYAAGTKRQEEFDLLAEPHPDMTDLEFWRLSYAHRLLWGDSFAQKLRDGRGRIAELWPISPWRVQDVRRAKPTPANPGGKQFDVVDDDGTLHTDLTTRDILHIPGFSLDGLRGVSVISHAAQSIGLSLAAEKSAARFFGRGSQVSGVLETDQQLEPKQADRLKDRWQAKTSGVDHAHEVAVLDSGAKFRPLTMPFRDAQLLESRQFGVTEAARFFGVPLFLLFETAKSTSWGTGLEQQAQGWVTFDLAPQWLAPTERRVTKELMRAEGHPLYARYSVEGLLRADSKARGEFYRVMREIGAFNADEVRELEDRPPIADGSGQTYLQPANLTRLGAGNNDGGGNSNE
jgi:HK97 family phage portal protein